MSDANNDSFWKVVRHDGVVAGSYGSKPSAVAAAIRLSVDGCGYEVLEERIGKRDAQASVVSMRAGGVATS